MKLARFRQNIAMKLAFVRIVALFAIAGAASVANAQHPQLLKRGGVVYGVRSLDNVGGCKGYPPGPDCEAYTFFGTITRVDFSPLTHRPEGFLLRMADGRTKFQNIVSVLPTAADSLIRPGRRVRVSGTMTGQGRVAIPKQIIAIR